MIGFLRFLVPLLVVLTALFVTLRILSRRARYRALEARWQANRVTDRATYMRRGMAAYDRSLRRKLIWGVYIVPICAIAAIVYAANYM